MESLFPITVTILPQDVRDPEFEMFYYTSVIPNSTVVTYLIAYLYNKILRQSLPYV